MSKNCSHLNILPPFTTSATSRDIAETCRATDSDTPLEGVSPVVSVPLKLCAEYCQLKPQTMFLPSRMTADGLLARCRECILSEAEKHRRHRELVRTRCQRIAKTKSTRRNPAEAKHHAKL
jgi:hypothetical protein